MRRILLCLSHSIEEYDQLRLFHGLGYEVASIGGYIDPANPHDDKRPALDVPCHPEVKEAVDSLGTEDNLGAAQRLIPAPVLEWLGPDGAIVFHHYLDRLFGQWDHLREWRAGGGRVIWRTVGQSVEDNELKASPFRADGLEIVRYSEKEAAIPGYAGRDALIRFYKDPDEWAGWEGDWPCVTNITQHLFERDPWCNPKFFVQSTRGLPVLLAGPGSEKAGGEGTVSLDRYKEILRQARCYLYTGTQPASYTLGLLEALVTGTPVVSIGPAHMQIFPYGPDLFEGHELAFWWSDDPDVNRGALRRLISDADLAAEVSQAQRERAAAEFGIGPVGQAWKEYLR